MPQRLPRPACAPVTCCWCALALNLTYFFDALEGCHYLTQQWHHASAPALQGACLLVTKDRTREIQLKAPSSVPERVGMGMHTWKLCSALAVALSVL